MNWRRLERLQATIICPYCLKPIPPKYMTVDHEPPKSRQKELGPSQLIPCCKWCNNEKGALTAKEYAEWKRLNAIRNGNMER